MAYKMSKYSDKVTDFNRDGTKTIQIGNELFSLGGWTPGNSYNDIYKTSDMVTWVKASPASAWTGRHTFGIGKISDKVFIWCGDVQHPAMDCWSTYDGVNYHFESNLPASMRFISGAFSDGIYLYLIGGMGNVYINDTMPHDLWKSPDGINWIREEGFPYLGRCLSGACCMFNKKIYVISGGIYGTLVGSQDMYSSADQGKTWFKEADVPFSGRYYHDTIVWDNKLWVIGGVHFSVPNVSVNQRDIWVMDADQNWTQFMGVPDDFIGRHASGVAVFQNKLVITNGNFNNNCYVIEKV